MSSKRLIAPLAIVAFLSLGVFVSATVSAEEECFITGPGLIQCEAESGGVVPPASSGVPAPPNQCGPWTQYFYIGPDGSPTVARRTLPDGSEETLYFRVCPAGSEFAWFRPYTAAEVAAFAYRDLQNGQLPGPTPSFSPPADNLLVNLETWFAATPTNPISVTAQVPGAWARATATVTSIELTIRTPTTRTGVTTVTCRPWGSTTASLNGCAWTPSFPSTEQVTGNADNSYTATLTLVWTVTWASSTGQTGTFPPLRTQTSTPLTVHEIQTIGGTPAG